MTILPPRRPNAPRVTPRVGEVAGGEVSGQRELVSEAEAEFERWRKRAGIFLAPLAFAIAWLLVPVTPTIKPEGVRLSAILSAVAVLWICETIPLPVTALLAAVLCVAFGVGDARTVFAPFADPIMFLFVGSFILARAMSLHGLDKRIALAFLSLPGLGTSPARVLAALGLVTALLSMWVTNTATTAMMLPIAVGILSALHEMRVSRGLAGGPLDARTWPFATGMMLMVAYAASIGGIGTPVGSAPNLISIGYLERLAGVRISFFQWMSVMVPMLVVMAPALFVLLYLLHPARRRTTVAGDGGARAPGDASPGVSGEMSAYLQREKVSLGPWTRGQLNTAVAFAVAVLLWVTPGMLAVVWGERDPGLKWIVSRFPEPAVALVAALLLFVLPTDLRRGRMTLTWSEAVQIDWGTILLFGGGLSLGALMLSTGVAGGLGNAVTSLTGTSSVWVLTGAAILMGIFLSETTSNTTSASIVVPVMIAAAQSAGLHPAPPALGAVLGASYGFMLPVSTPPNAIVYGSGLVPMQRMIRAGAAFDMVGFFIIWGGLRVLCPLMGLA